MNSSGVGILCVVGVLLVQISAQQHNFVRTSGLSLSGVAPLFQQYRRSVMQCAILCIQYTDKPWPCQTISYNNDQCTLYAQSTIHETWDGVTSTNYWIRSVST